MKKKIKVISIVIVIVIAINAIFPSNVYGLSGDVVKSIGGKLLTPIMELFVTLSDAAVDIVQKVVFGIDADAIVEVNRTGEFWSIALGVYAGLAVLAGSVILAVIFAPVTGVVATIAVVGSTVVMSIGTVIKTYLVTSTIVSSMLTNTFQLPFIAISPENIIQNKIDMFSVNFFSNEDTQDSADGDMGGNINIAQDLHQTIAKWYYTIRTVVIVLFLIELIYIGLRIVVTSIAEDKSKYKKMLFDWGVSFCLLFVIHYIMIFSMELVDEFTILLSNVTGDESVEYFDIKDDKVYDYVKENIVDSDDRPSWIKEKVQQAKGRWKKFWSGESNSTSGGDSDYNMIYIDGDGQKTVRFPVDNFMSQARIKAQLLDKEGNERYVTVGWQLIYVMLTLYMIRFLWIYLRRVVYIAFLILIAPIVVLTYSIDKFRDGQAQGFNMWLREYLFNLAIQPFHLILFTVFVGSAMTLASKSPIYVLVVMGFMAPAEKILRSMFGFEKATTPGVLSGAVGTGLAMSSMQKLFGRKPPQIHDNKTTAGIGRGDNEKETISRIKEPEGRESFTEIEGAEDKEKLASDKTEKDEKNKKRLGEDAQENVQEDVKEGKEFSKTKDSKGMHDSGDASEARIAQAMARIKKSKDKNEDDNKKKQVITSKNKVTRKKRKKAKLKIGRGLKGMARHYVQSKGQRIANRAMNFNPVRSIASGAAALTAGTAGVILGAMDASPEKSIRNAGIAGAAAYKGVSNIMDANRVDGMMESFKKAGYGDEYKDYKNQITAKEIRNNLEIREEIKEEMGWDNKELKKFLNETIDEYMESGIKSFDDMLVAEKLKKNEVARDTSEAIGIMAMGQKIGTDTTKLTDKKKEEWAETFMGRNKTMDAMQKKFKKLNEEYEKRIQEVKEQELDKQEERKLIKEIRNEMQGDQEYNKLKNTVQEFQRTTFEKLDKYSEYKYKG